MSPFPLKPEEFAQRLIELYGGRENLQKALHAELDEINRIWSQNAPLMGRILKAHLFVEYFLNKYLEFRNPNLGDVENARLSFSQKVALAENTDSPESYLFPGIKRLNQVRNRLAHNLNAELTDDDRDCFLSCKPFAALRDALGKPMVPNVEGIVVLEEFAKHAGMSLLTASNGSHELWTKAMQGNDDGQRRT